MKKILVLILTSLLALCCFGVVFATALTADKTQAAAPAAEQGNVYLVPGVYKQNGKNVVNNVTSGAKKLTKAECDAIFTENAYLCTLPAGSDLPTPTSKRVDAKGNAFAFNGWWSIVDATVTYFDKVPQTTEDFFLYADWRADLSQRKDPISPEDQAAAKHYLTITHTDGSVDKLTLRPSRTDMFPTAEQLGYGYATELSGSLTLQPGDVIKVYTVGLTNDVEAKCAPVSTSGSRTIILDSSSEQNNNTASFLSKTAPAYYKSDCYMTYIGTTTRTFNIYIKFYSGGAQMNVYMAPAA